MMTVFDSSAVLAVIFNEKGSEVVEPRLLGGAISTLNYGEVIDRMIASGRDLADAIRVASRIQLRIIPFDQAQAERVAELREPTSPFGLSLCDRACVALAERLGAPVMTGDRRWAEAPLPVTVELIR
ncbi:MAG TPA: type II toxin-antitoxin system VapC family toxin [Allosphingosinicella sp.]|jgi:PIN domain nuclease of toxin-antitoxin system